MRAAFLLLLTLTILTVPEFYTANGLPQQVAPIPQPPPPLAPDSNHRIVLDVVVTDVEGKPVSGLQQQDFTILDNKKAQTIASFREAMGLEPKGDPPIRATVVVDAVNSSTRHLAVQRVQLAQYLRRTNKLPVLLSLAYFIGKSPNPTEPTDNGIEAARSVDATKLGFRAIKRSAGFYGDVEREQTSVNALQQMVAAEVKLPGRKLLIWMGPGWPYLAGPGQNLGAKGAKSLFENIVWFSTVLRRGRITLYSIDLTENLEQPFDYQEFLRGALSPKDVGPGNIAVQVMAIQSGGDVLTRSNNLGGSLAQCLQDARNYYTLTFDAAPGSRPDEYRSLQVTVGKPHVTVRTRTGYYAQP